MRLLLAIDRSAHSDAAVEDVARRLLPEGSEVEVLTVLHSSYPATAPMPALIFSAAHAEDLRAQEAEAPQLVDAVVRKLQRARPGIRITTKIVEGEPDEVIVQEASDWQADLIVLGTHDRGRLGETLMGSTARTVAERAACPVEIVHATPPLP
jgi:nucleotide-binding universal stress UspA family protein